MCGMRISVVAGGVRCCEPEELTDTEGNELSQHSGPLGDAQAGGHEELRVLFWIRTCLDLWDGHDQTGLG